MSAVMNEDPMTKQLPDYLTTEQVSKLFQVSIDKLAEDRATGRGLPYFKIGRLVRYSRVELDAYLAKHRISTKH